MEPPSLASGVLFFRNDPAQVLLVRQGYGRRLWTTPGGMLETGESPQDAALREVQEELGLAVELLHLVGVYFVQRLARRSRIGFLFMGELPVGAEPMIADPELDDIGWFRVDDLPDPCSPGLDVVIHDALGGGRGLARTIHDATP